MSAVRHLWLGFFAASCLLAQPGAAPPERDRAAEALAGFDETTGLWFPPDAPREVYLDGSDPTHNLPAAWQRIFASDPALRRAVCALVTDSRREPRAAGLSPTVRQRRTMLTMFCVGAAPHEDEQERERARWRTLERNFDAWRDTAAARALDEDARKDRAEEREGATTDVSDAEAQLRISFEILGLIPQSDVAVYRLLSTNPYRGTRVESRFVGAFQGLLEREAAPGMPEASRYRSGLCAFHFYRGDVEKARLIARALVTDPALERWWESERAFLALLEHLQGTKGALAGLTTDCPLPERFRSLYEDRPPGAFCFDVVSSVAVRFVDLLGSKAPVGAADALAASIDAEPTNWRRRVMAIERIEILDPARARGLADDLLRVPATLVPLEIRLDALAVVGSASRRVKDTARAVWAYDFFLANLRYRPAPPPPDLWNRLTALEYEEPGRRVGDTRTPGLDVTWALGRKAATFLEAGDAPRARRAIEAYLAESLRLVDALAGGRNRVSDLVDTEGLNPAELDELRRLLDEHAEATARRARDEARWARVYLGELGRMWLKAGRREDAVRVVAYLAAQKGPEGSALPSELLPLYWEPKARGAPLKPAASPWEAAAPPAPARR